jgi:GT2 family glycosyltransferase
MADTAGPVIAPRVSVIIPHYNMPDALERCLGSVKAQRLDHGTVQLIVVDNGSTVAPPTAVAARHPDVLFLSETTPGPGPARNTGVAAATAPTLAFIDADCRAGAGWLQAAVDGVEAEPGRGVVGGDVRIDFIDERHLTGIEAYEAVFAYRQAMYINRQHFSGTGNLAMAAPVHKAVGPFAGIETAEDRDWGRRATAAGYRIRYVDAMRAFHPARDTFESLERKWRRHIEHDWHDHKAGGRPVVPWILRALAMVASIPVEALRILVSDRLSGLANKLRGIGILARVRWFRTAEMLRVIRNTTPSGAGWRDQS